MTDGALPAGLTLAGSPRPLSGTPDPAGRTRSQCAASDQFGNVGLQAYSGQVLPSVIPVPTMSPIALVVVVARILASATVWRLRAS